MTTVLPGLVLAAFGLAMVALGRWGQGHAETLVPAVVPEKRRVKELRTIRRGATSCLLFGAFCLINGVVFLVVAQAGK